MFRDSRGVVHTVSSADPLEDLPRQVASALARALLVPSHGDLGGALERCEAVRELLDRWQDAFFAALPLEVDLEEEARWAAEAGLSLEEIESQWEDDNEDWEEDESPGQLGLDEIDLSELTPLPDEHEGLFTPRWRHSTTTSSPSSRAACCCSPCACGSRRSSPPASSSTTGPTCSPITRSVRAPRLEARRLT